MGFRSAAVVNEDEIGEKDVATFLLLPHSGSRVIQANPCKRRRPRACRVLLAPTSSRGARYERMPVGLEPEAPRLAVAGLVHRHVLPALRRGAEEDLLVLMARLSHQRALSTAISTPGWWDKRVEISARRAAT